MSSHLLIINLFLYLLDIDCLIQVNILLLALSTGVYIAGLLVECRPQDHTVTSGCVAR